MTTQCRMDYLALAQVPCADFPTIVHAHLCPDVLVPSFPFGPLLRAAGDCDHPIPLCCAFCERITEQPCRQTYRVANTGASWDGKRDEICQHKEIAVLVECAHCHAPSDFHIQLALFKEYYEEVLDMVRVGRVSLFDVRRSVTVVSFWPPEPGGDLLRLVSRVASDVSDALTSDLVLPVSISSLVMEYWQGVADDFLSPISTYATSFGLYDCTHVWPCVNHRSFDRPCLWTRWSQHWIDELHLCDHRLYNPYRHGSQLPRSWNEWVDQRRSDWLPVPITDYPVYAHAPAYLAAAREGMFTHFYNSFDGGAEFMEIVSKVRRFGNYPQYPTYPLRGVPHSKLAVRNTDAWYSPFASHPFTYQFVGSKMPGPVTYCADGRFMDMTTLPSMHSLCAKGATSQIFRVTFRRSSSPGA
jgi:hypothetical protein